MGIGPESMNDKELADKVVALGVFGESIIEWPGRDPAQNMVLYQDSNRWITVEKFVRDWRVAGALMEKLESYDGFVLRQSGDDAGTCGIVIAVRSLCAGTGSNGNMCRAIIEACVEALSE